MNFDSIYEGRRARCLQGGRVNHIVATTLDSTARCGVSTWLAAVTFRGRLCKKCVALEARAQAVPS